jgi:hypothetical protein
VADPPLKGVSMSGPMTSQISGKTGCRHESCEHNQGVLSPRSASASFIGSSTSGPIINNLESEIILKHLVILQ